ERPGGRRFGALVHAILASIDLRASIAAITALAQTNGRILDATSAEVEAASTTVRAALNHPLLRRAAEAKALRRETPLQYRRSDGSLLEGVADLAFYEKGSDFEGWTVLDFKTDREIGAAQNQYLAQVAAYVEAVRTATEQPTRGFLLVV